MKFGSKKAIFGAIWGGFEGFGPCLGVSHPTHPYLGEISQKKPVFFFWHHHQHPQDHHQHSCQLIYQATLAVNRWAAVCKRHWLSLRSVKMDVVQVQEIKSTFFLLGKPTSVWWVPALPLACSYSCPPLASGVPLGGIQPHRLAQF